MTLYTVRKRKSEANPVQGPGYSQFLPVDPDVASMQVAIARMGISAIRVLDGNEGYQALDLHGLVVYQWREVSELREQMLQRRAARRKRAGR